MMNPVEERNKEFYDTLYGGHGPFMFFLHGKLSFDQKSKTRANIELLEPIIRKKISTGKSVRILDYGCGWGTFLFSLPHDPKLELFCFDISSKATEMLSKAAKFAGYSVEVVPDVSNPAVLPGDFDVILCSHVLEHVEADNRLLDVLSKSLKHGGVLLVNVPVNEEVADPRHVRQYDEGSLRQKMISAGLSAISCVMADRWTVLLTRIEQKSWLKCFARCLRLALALMPYNIVKCTERFFIAHGKCRQLLMMGERI